MLNIEKRRDGDVTVVDLAGDFDMAVHRQVEGLLGELTSTLDNLVWNFRKVDSMSSSGIGILMNAYAELKKQGKMLKLVNVRPEVLDVLQVHKVLSAFDIHSDEMAAKKQINIDLEEQDKAFVRLFERINVSVPATFKCYRCGREARLFRVHRAEAKSLSRGGLYLKTTAMPTDTIIPRDTVVEVGLQLPVGDGPEKTVTLLGKVAWVATDTQHELYPGMALSIASIEEGELRKLESFLSSQGV